MGTTQKIVAGAAALMLLVAGSWGAWTASRGGRPAGRAAETAPSDTVAAELRDERQRVHVDEHVTGSTAREDAPAALPPPVDLDAVDRDRDLHGRVVDAEGEPLPGAAISLLRYPWRRASVLNHAGYSESDTVAEALSAEDGTFSFRLRRGALVDVHVEAAGFVPRTVSAVQAGERLLIEMAQQHGGGVDVTIAVVDEADAAVAGATVRVFSVAGQSDLAIDVSDETDDGGTALFESLPAGASLHADVDAPGLGSPSWVPFRVPDTGPHVETIRLPAGRTITGTVTDVRTGLPVSGAVIGMNWVQSKAVASGPDGRYELVGWTGRGAQEIAVTADGYGRQDLEVGERETVDIALQPGDTVVGRLVDPDGSPVPGALVAAIASRHDGRTQEISVGHATSGADGRFAVSSLRHDLLHTLVVTADGLGRTLYDFEPHPGVAGVIDLGDVPVHRGFAIEGVVRDPEGEPVAGVPVVLTGTNRDRGRWREGAAREDRFHYGRSEERHTDDLGRFRFPDQAPGSYDLAARPPGAPERGRHVDLVDGDVLDAEIRMSRGRSVTVTALGPDGTPLPGAIVSAIGTRIGGRTGDDGKCTLLLESTHPVQVVVWGGGELPDDLVQPPAQLIAVGAVEATFRFERGKLVRARVLDDADQPLEGAHVEIHVGGKMRTSALAGADGRIEWKVAGEEPVDLVFKGTVQTNDGRMARIDKLPLRGEARRVVPGGESVTIRCRAIVCDRKLTFHVVGPDGEPFENARVWSFDAGIAPDAVHVTDSTGSVTIDGLPPDACTFVAYPKDGRLPEGWLAPRQQRLKPEGQTIELAFRRAAEITGTLLDREGRPVVGAGVEARLPDDSTFNGHTEAGGHFSVSVPADEPAFTVTAAWANSDGSPATATRTDVRPNTDIRLRAE